MKKYVIAGLAAALWLGPAARAQTTAPKSKVIEQVVAHVNDEVITLSDYQRSEGQLKQEAAQECQNCTDDRIEAMLGDRKKNLLRDMIDQSLLAQHAKDAGIDVETDVIRQLDDVRKQNNLASMEDLQKEVEGQGVAWEDYKAGIRRQLLTQTVIRKEVGPRVNIGSDEVHKYYDEHKSEFVKAEEVSLGEISFSTQGKSPEETAAIRKKADDLLARLKSGDDFSELAKRSSDGPTAHDGGYLGEFQRGQLSPEFEKQVFGLKKGEYTEVIQTANGFEILKVFQHYEAGLQPVEKVESEITNKLFAARVEPVIRDYLSELREQSYVVVAPGYLDTGAAGATAGIQETAPTPDTTGKKKRKGKGS